LLANRGWNEQLYWGIRNDLIGRGLLITGRGKGGSVRRTGLAPSEAAQVKPEVIAATVQAERDLYAPMAEVIRGRWAKDYSLDPVIVEITAAQGPRQKGGKWTRPDITLATYRAFPYVPGRHFDLITFEVKIGEATDVTVVYEALGQRRAATRAYALIYVPEEKADELENTLTEIFNEANRLRIRMIVAADPGNYDTWETWVEADRQEFAPERLNEFLALQVSDGFREQIMRWFR
jgi:hypothetical protein